MTHTTRERIRGIATIIHAILVLLIVLGLGFQVYAFYEYRGDVRENRELLCKAPALAKTEYCQRVAAIKDIEEYK